MLKVSNMSKEPWVTNNLDYFDVKKTALLTMNMSVQEKAFVNWCNIYLKTKGCKIERLAELSDGRYVILLLEAISGKQLAEDGNWKKVEMPDNSQILENWRMVRQHFEKEGILLPTWPEKKHLVQQNQQLISELIWQCILHYHVARDDETMSKGSSIDYDRAANSLLKWVQEKIPEHKIRDFVTDFSDGKALCALVNTIAPGTIPESMYLGDKMPEMSVRVAMQAAEDELGIPELIPPYEMVNGNADEKSILTYIALFRSAERMSASGIRPISTGRLIENIQHPDSAHVVNGCTSYLEKRSLKCIAYGSGLRYGEVGKPAEFIVQLNGVQPSDLSISIECKPYDQRIPVYKPELRIKPVGETSYIVRYTPTRPGNFIISIFCGGDHIPNSPFNLSIKETVNSYQGCKEDDLTFSRDSGIGSNSLYEGSVANGSLPRSSPTGKDNLSSSFVQTTRKTFMQLLRDGSLLDDRILEPQCEAKGPGLYGGEVGVMGNFTVYTPNSDQGPLSVCVTCPAMSIPVPHVRTKVQDCSLVHEVMYLPTEAGIYEIDIKWGSVPIKGSPFRLVVNDARFEPNHTQFTLPEIARVPCFELQKARNAIIYFSATASGDKEREKKDQLVDIIKGNLDRMPSVRLLTIAIDLEVSNSDRKKIFKEAGSSKLPVVFLDGQYFGNHQDIVNLNEKDLLIEKFMRHKEIAAEDKSSGNKSPSFRKRIMHHVTKHQSPVGKK